MPSDLLAELRAEREKHKKRESAFGRLCPKCWPHECEAGRALDCAIAGLETIEEIRAGCGCGDPSEDCECEDCSGSFEAFAAMVRAYHGEGEHAEEK